MKCPQCKHIIMPFKVLLISRWTFIKCPSCGAQLGRKTDLQMIATTILLIVVLGLLMFILMNSYGLEPLPSFGIALFVVLLFGSLVDAATVRLVRVKENKPEDTVERVNPN